MIRYLTVNGILNRFPVERVDKRFKFDEIMSRGSIFNQDLDPAASHSLLADSRRSFGDELGS